MAQFRGAWLELYERSESSLPFHHPNWTLRWWQSFGASSAMVRRELLIVAVYDGAALVGIMPFYRTIYGLRAWVNFKFVRPVGTDNNLTELRTPLTLPGYERLTLATTADYFRAHPHSWDLFNWSHLPDGSVPTPDFPGHQVVIDEHPATEMFLLPLPATWDVFSAGLKRNTKEAVRKCHNSLRRDGIAVTFTCEARPDRIAGLLPSFFDLHSRRAALVDTVPHPDVFATKLHRDFLQQLLLDLGDSGPVRLFYLQINGKIVAARLAFLSGGMLYLYFSGYDPDYGKYSIMTRLFVEIIKWAIGQGLRTVNLSQGRDPAKTRWNPTVRAYRSYAHLSLRWQPRLMFAVIRQLTARKQRRIGTGKAGVQDALVTQVIRFAPRPVAEDAHRVCE